MGALPDVIRHTALRSSDFPLPAPESAESDRPVRLPTASIISDGVKPPSGAGPALNPWPQPWDLQPRRSYSERTGTLETPYIYRGPELQGGSKAQRIHGPQT